MRYLGVDIGKKRTGLAISDPTGMIARPLEVVAGGADAAALGRALRPIVEREDVEVLVIGLPRRMGGEEGPEAVHARAVGVHLTRALGLPVEMWDERLSTVEATERLIADGVGREERQALVDQVAAALILQGFLDSRHGPVLEPAP